MVRRRKAAAWDLLNLLCWETGVDRGGSQGLLLIAVKARAAAAPSGRGRPWSFGRLGEGNPGTEGRRPRSLSGGENGTATLHAVVVTILGILWVLNKLLHWDFRAGPRVAGELGKT